MIPLNSWQRLPSKAIWFGLLSSLLFVAILAAVGVIFQASGRSGFLSGLLYLYAIFLVGRSVLYYKTYAFLLTDKTLTTISGYLYKRSCTFRFDRIQDIDTFSGPIQAMFGLKAVAIWTSSPDQFAGNRKRPDARIVLDAESADWLRDYLSNPPAAAGTSAASPALQPSELLKAAPRADVGWVVILCAAAALAVPVVLLWSHASLIRPGAPAAASPTAAASAAMAPDVATSTVQKNETDRHQAVAVRQPLAPLAPVAQAAQVPPDYAVACAIHGSGSIDGVIPCAKFGEAKRCQRETEFASKPTPEPAMLTVVNRSSEDVKFYWLDRSGSRALYASLSPSGHVTQRSHLGARWLVSTKDDRCIAIFDAATMTIGIY